MTFAELPEHGLQREYEINDETQPVSSHQLQQQELVAFLYHRFRVGIFITLLVSLLASALAYVELAIQGRERWVVGWFVLLCLVMLLRWRVLQQFFGTSKQVLLPLPVLA